MPSIQTLILQFENELSPAYVPKFRGAVIASLNQNNILFHNHDKDGVVYRYPRIQYKRIHKKAAIVCVKEGVQAIHELLASDNFTFQIAGKPMEMRIESVTTVEHALDFCSSPKSYHLHNWLPLNSENYKEFQTIEGLADRITFLEEKLVGNLLSFFKEMKFDAEKQIVLKITDITAQRLARYKGVKLMAFDIDFKVNLSLPQYVGIGKSASIGFGILTRKKNN